ncbi:hypothetical protein HDV00_003162 [Rhizophlyctis rosea]|nr:hypothetical protein HDV00_003162 [Rhizophlyctis rosea]
MKFAKQLMLRAVPSWSDHYMDYKSLKKMVKDSSIRLKETQGDDISAVKATLTQEFCDAVKVEAQKVEDWHSAKEKEAEGRLETLDGAWSVTMNDEEQENWISEMDGLILALENLLEFCSANNAAFKKILKV